jgi:hypothetical protein
VNGSTGARLPNAPFARVRQVVLASVIVFLTLAGHAAASGALPAIGGLLLAVLISSGLTLVAIARTRSWSWLFAFLLGSQVLLHGVLVVSSGHVHGASSPLLPTAWMGVAHVVAAGLAAAALARGEAVLTSWAALLSASLGFTVAALDPVGAPVCSRTRVDSWFPITSDGEGAASRRGPPRRHGA